MSAVSVRWIVVGLLLVGAVFGAREVAHAQKKLEPSHAEVVALAKDYAKGKKITPKQAQAFRKKYDDLHDVMHIYNIKKGLGIEKRLLDLGKTAPTAASLAKDKDALVELGYINVVMSDLVRPYFEKPVKGKGKKDWERYSDEQKTAAEEFIAAVNKLDPMAVKKAAVKITDACESCHVDFK